MLSHAMEKLQILADDAKYDLSCSCGTNSPDDHRKRTDFGSWLYPVSLASGGTGTILKTLVSNACSSDCRYCPFRHNGSSAQRCSLTPDEIAALFMEYHRRLHLHGVFLSSGILGTPDHTMEILTDAAAILRHKYQYRGYIHLKIIPGASEAAMDSAMSLASAVSLNIETPGKQYFRQLSTYKDFDRDIVRPLRYMADHTGKGTEHKKVKCTTQFIVGAATETDAEIVRYMGAIYDHLHFKRVYFSAYQPPPDADFALDDGSGTLRLNREHRLYQTDFLLRKYGFSPNEILFSPTGNLDLKADPKLVWAMAHPEFYPVRVNTADREALLRIPGIGPVHATRILALRKIHSLRDFSDIRLPPKVALKASHYAVFS